MTSAQLALALESDLVDFGSFIEGIRPQLEAGQGDYGRARRAYVGNRHIKHAGRLVLLTMVMGLEELN